MRILIEGNKEVQRALRCGPAKAGGRPEASSATRRMNPDMKENLMFLVQKV